ncbi:TAP-like protein-domain-containing protein [Tricladium varicosporioides]|nr:TAP-like protein-domain-containing protein [Hymenoscyphus varicosporioides]
MKTKMRLQSALPQLFLLLGKSIIATPVNSPYNARTLSFQWSSCSADLQQVATLPVDCANFTVPLDYSDPTSNETLVLTLLRVPAVNKPSRGSIQINFGGPGVPVRDSLAGAALSLQAITGGYFDLIGFDPRGTANTLTFSCYDNETERANALISGPGGIANASDTALGLVWAVGTVFAEQCHSRPESRKRGSLINTAFVARDMMSIVDGLGEDGLLRYYGFSYGSLLGETVVAMFPDRIDKVVIDGIMNPFEYYTGAEPQVWTSADAAFHGFLSECLKAPSNCTLASSHTSVDTLEASIYNMIYDLKFNPRVIGGMIVDYTILKSTVRASLYSTFKFSTLANLLNGLLTRNDTQCIEAYTALTASTLAVLRGKGGDESPFGIHCSDKAYRRDSRASMNTDIERLYNSSQLLGDFSPVLLSICARWKMDAKERAPLSSFTNVKTKTPVLIIGNTYDSATSINAAFNVSAGFVDSVVLRQDGYGHCSLGQPSICTSKAVRSYFMDGTLPEQGAVCDVSVPPFSKMTIYDILPELGFNISMIKKGNAGKRGLDLWS